MTTTPRVSAFELRQIADRASTDAHDLGIELAIASDIGASKSEIKRIEDELTQAIAAEAIAWDAVAEAEEREFEQYLVWNDGRHDPACDCAECDNNRALDEDADRFFDQDDDVA